MTRAAAVLVLDLYCGAGGAAMGYHQALEELGIPHTITGVDIKPMSRYPFNFIQGDALEYLAAHGAEYGFIHASPPCQGYSRLRHLPWLRDKQYPLLIDDTLSLLRATSKPWIVENVEDAPLDGITLCGRMFGLPVYRHRKFSSSVLLLQPVHQRHEIVIGSGRMINDRRKGSLNASSATGALGNQTIVTVAGGLFRKADGARALGVDWMSKPELAQAIPPAYTRCVGLQLWGNRV